MRRLLFPFLFTFCLTFVLALGVAQAQTFSVLHTFTNIPDGAFPEAGLIRDAAGNLYGTTYLGGNSTCQENGNFGCGTVFKVDVTGKETVLYSFTGTAGGDGANPAAGLVRDAKGKLYGTTGWGGVSNWGTVFKLDVTGKEIVSYSFAGGTDGAFPSGLVRDKAGNLYGTTSGCDGYSYCNGTVFKLDTAGKKTVLYNFTGGTDGATPAAGLVRDPAGNLYGTTNYGGDLNTCTHPDHRDLVMMSSANPPMMYPPNGCGTVFKLDTTGKETVLYNFTGTGSDGAYPGAGLIRDANGNLYGTTVNGGIVSATILSSSCGWNVGCGTVFELTPSSGGWTETVLYRFTGKSDGGQPYAGLVRDAKGNLYGTANDGGTGCNGYGCGVVFQVTKAGKEKVLYAFTGGTDGGYPVAGLVRDKVGNLYGTAQLGGYGYGTVFKLVP